jgi:polyhydroxybutyrate depolymerase
MLMRKMIRATSTFVEWAVVVIVAFVLTAGGAVAEPIEIVVNGQTRTAIVERSAGAERQPTVIMLHGSGGEAAGLGKITGLPRLAQQQGFVAVFPQGGWNFLPPDFKPPDGRQLPDDAAFLKMLIAELVRLRISDPERVYLSGFSLGGFMALRMICMEPGPFAGVALFSAAMPELVGDRCRPTKPIPFLLRQSTGDQLVPYECGRLGRSGLPVWSAERLVAFFRAHNGCANAGKQTVAFQQSSKVEIEHATTCSGAPVVNYRIVGGGHSIPWMDISRLLWLFFSGKLVT